MSQWQREEFHYYNVHLFPGNKYPPSYTIGNGLLPVMETLTTPVCLICFDGSSSVWAISGGDNPAGIPGAPYILYVMSPTTTIPVLPSGITDTYVNITWQLENPAGFIDYFILSYRLESSQTWNVAAPILSNGTLNYLLTGLSPNTTYVVGVATKNGLLHPSNYTTVTFTTAGMDARIWYDLLIFGLLQLSHM